ncbi:MAG: 4'-phosphopantetheinyl transferase superfamily protein [Bacteroidota bacterium]|jgi:4'-phosphopantetheinyl transferase
MRLPQGSFLSSARIGIRNELQFAGMAVLPIIQGMPAGSELTGLLHPKEKEKAAAFASEIRRISFIYGRIAAKLAILKVFPEVRAQEINIVNGALGEPVVEWKGSEHPVSISHSEHHSAGLVFPPGIPMGIDIETPEEKNRSIIPSILSPDEMQLLTAANDSIEFLHLLWTAKEAAGKANGQGFRLPVEQYEIKTVTICERDGRQYFLSQFSRLAGFHALTVILDKAVLSVAFPSWPGLPDQVTRLLKNHSRKQS